ncbi:MAG: class I SAM-dependent methyltransferase [Erysipelotrichaceae bacterium]|nr:class I SAM-dependent methyltransferase [Erysipelotrichaceae bacterium]
MAHYFTNDDNLKHNRREFSFYFMGKPYTFVTDDGVFSKDSLDYGTMVLLEMIMECPLGQTVLDLGCGYGPVGILLKQYHPELKVTMADVNERATELAKENVKRYRLDNEVVVSDIYSNVHATFDSIVVNPPIRAGKAVIYAMFDGAADRLNPGGTLYVVMRKSHGANSAMAHLTEIFGNCEMIGREKGYFVFKSTKN